MPEKVIQNEPTFTLIEYPLNVNRTVSNEIPPVSEMSIINDRKNLITAAWQDT